MTEMKQASSLILLFITSGISIAYYITFKSYHASLTKLDTLKALLTNTKARVAAGETGKSIVARLTASKNNKQTNKKVVESV